MFRTRRLFCHLGIAACLFLQVMICQANTLLNPVNNPSETSKKPHTVYITNHDNNTVTVCKLSGNHLSGCKDSGAGPIFGAPIGIVVNHHAEKGFAYVASDSFLSVCKINPHDDTLSHCVQQNKAFPSVAGLGLNPDESRLYVTSNKNMSAVFVCKIDPESGQLDQCSQTGTDFHYPVSVAVSPSGNFALVANFDDTINAARRLSSCLIDQTTGQLKDCGPAGSGFSYPSDIKFSSDGQKVYVGGYYTHSLSVCSFNPATGFTNNCSSSGAAGIALPTSIALSQNLALMTSNKKSIVVCRRDATSGFMDKCADTGATELASPSAVAVR